MSREFIIFATPIRGTKTDNVSCWVIFQVEGQNMQYIYNLFDNGSWRTHKSGAGMSCFRMQDTAYPYAPLYCQLSGEIGSQSLLSEQENW